MHSVIRVDTLSVRTVTVSVPNHVNSKSATRRVNRKSCMVRELTVRDRDATPSTRRRIELDALRLIIEVSDEWHIVATNDEISNKKS